MRIGVICALEQEIQNLHNALLCVDRHVTGSVAVYEADFYPHTLFLTVSGIGKTCAAVAAHTLITDFKCEVIINTGLAGGCDSRIAPGAVVLAEKAVYHDFNVGTLSGADNYSGGFPADMHFTQLAKNVIASQGIDFVEGTVASGDSFICDDSVKKDIVERTGCLCVDMEAAAIAHVAYMNDIPYMSLKVISDNADESAHTDFDMSLKLYTEYCSDFIIRMLDSI